MSERNTNDESAGRDLATDHGSQSMTFSDSAQPGFKNWRLFNRASAKSLVAETPAEPGVYAIRRRQERSEGGEHEVVYIGSAENQSGLQMRLRQHFHPGRTQGTNLRILDLCGESDKFDVAYVTTPRARAKDLRRELLEQFEQAWGRLPAENKRR